MIIGILTAVAFLLAFIFMPKVNVENARASNLGDFKFPRANEGDPLPLVWGTVRLKSPNTIWFGDFRADPITEKVKTGLFSSKRVVVGYKYYIGIDLALCLGPGVVLRRFWAGKYTPWSGNLSAEGDFVINAPDLFGGDKQGGGMQGACTFYPGSFTQSRDPYLASKLDPNVPRYGGIAHIVMKSFYVGTTTNLQAFNMEVSRLTDTVAPGYGIMPNGLDANPVEILFDALTSKFGRLGLEVSVIDIPNWVAAAQTLYTENNGMSLKLEGAVNGKTVADEVMRQIDGMLFQDPENMLIKIKLLRNDYDVNTLPVLDQSAIKSMTNFSKTTWDSTFNQCRVKFTNREKEYEDSVATAQDLANINFQQRVRSTELSFPACTDPVLASKLASRGLGVYSVPLYKCDLICNRTASTLRPGDVFILSWDPFGLEEMVMRVQKVDLGDLTNGEVRLSVIQDKFATNHMVFAPPEQSGWQPLVVNPVPIPIRFLIETPRFLEVACGVTPAAGNATFYSGARKPSSQSKTYDVELTTDGFTNVYLSLDDGFYIPTGQLVNAYDASAGGTSNWDSTVGIRVAGINDMSGLRFSNSVESMDGRNLIIIGDEILSYDTYTSNVDGTITLNNVHRKFLDTPKFTHAANSVVFFLQGIDGMGETQFPNNATVTGRMRDNTPTGRLPAGSALLNVVTASRRAARPAAPVYLTLNGSRVPTPVTGATTVTANWRERNRNSAMLAWYDDPTQTPEAGTTYSLRYRIGAGAWSNVSGLIVPSYNVPVTGLSGTLEVEVWAVRDTLASTVTESLTINVSP